MLEFVILLHKIVSTHDIPIITDDDEGWEVVGDTEPIYTMIYARWMQEFASLLHT